MSYNDSNPFEVGPGFNATRALQMARNEPEKARSQFDSAARRGRLDPHLARSEAALFPPPPVDPYAWVDMGES